MKKQLKNFSYLMILFTFLTSTLYAADAMNSITGPTSISKGETITLTVDFEADADRTIAVYMQSLNPTKLQFYKRINVQAGETSKEVTFTVPETIPTSGTLRYKAYIAPRGGKWKDNLGYATQNGVTVKDVVVNDTIKSISGPTTITKGENVTLTVDYVASQDRTIAVYMQSLKPTKLQFYKRITVHAGDELEEVSFTVPNDIPTSGTFKYTAYIAPKGGNWSSRLGVASQKGVTLIEHVYKAPYKLLPLNGKIYFGAIPSFMDEDNIPLGETGKQIIRDFDKLAGYETSWTYIADNWGVNNLTYPKDKINMILSTNKIPFVRMMPVKGGSGISPMGEDATYNPAKTYPLINIAKDPATISKIRAWAVASKRHYEERKQEGKPFYLMLDFAPEMNGYWFQWGGAHQNHEEYKAAYRKIIDIFREVKVPHVTWIFHPVLTNMEWYEEKRLEGLSNFQHYLTWAEPANYYPGDEYIDWVGFSNYGRDEHIANVRDDYYPSFSGNLETDGNRIFNFAQTKPRMVAEFGVIENPYNSSAKAVWLENALETMRLHGSIKAINYWNQSWKDNDGHSIDMSIDSSTNSLNAFRRGLNAMDLIIKSDIPRAE